jgi:hypothetical protein
VKKSPLLLCCSVDLLPIVHILFLFSSPASLIFWVKVYGKGEVLPIFNLRCFSYRAVNHGLPQSQDVPLR